MPAAGQLIDPTGLDFGPKRESFPAKWLQSGYPAAFRRTPTNPIQPLSSRQIRGRKAVSTRSFMLKTGILNPAVLSLLARVRHTNTLVIADRGFPYWPQIETVDLALVDDLPTVLQVLDALRPNFVIGRAFAADEFRRHNDSARLQALTARLDGIPLVLEPHVDFKKRVPQAIGLIRTGDTIPYANLILESA